MSKEMNVLGREFLYWVRKKFDGLKTDKHIEEKALHTTGTSPKMGPFNRLRLTLRCQFSYCYASMPKVAIGSFSK